MATTYNTKELLAQLKSQTELLLDEVKPWRQQGSETLAAKPNKEAWSAAECLEHLNSYGNYYLPAIRQAIGNAQTKGSKPISSFKSSWLGGYFTKTMKPRADGSVKKMKAPKNHRPEPQVDVRKAVETFIHQQEEFIVLLSKAGKVNLENTKVPISIAKFIKLKLGDVFMFMVAHNERHVAQGKRAMATGVIREVSAV